METACYQTRSRSCALRHGSKLPMLCLLLLAAMWLTADAADDAPRSAPVKAPPPRQRGDVVQVVEPIKFKAGTVDWKAGEEPKGVVAPRQGIAFISGVAGKFAGPGEVFELQVAKNGAWTLGGNAGDFIAARATAVANLTPVRFSPQVTRYAWSAGKPAVKMLHQKDGICLLAGVSGAFHGYGEEVKVHLADDGYWYLEGRSAQGEMRAAALGLKWSKPGLWTCSATTASWSTGKDPVEVGEENEGLCVLSGFSGSLQGGGEGGEIIQQEGKWVLRGKSQQEALRFDATLIRFKKAK